MLIGVRLGFLRHVRACTCVHPVHPGPQPAVSLPHNSSNNSMTKRPVPGDLHPLNCHIEVVHGKPYRQFFPPAHSSQRQAAQPASEAAEQSQSNVTEDSGVPLQQTLAARPVQPTKSQPQAREEPQGPSPVAKAAAEPLDQDLLDSVKQDGQSYLGTISIDTTLFPHLIGRQGANRQKLEQETGATITFPRRDASGTQSSEVVVRGGSKEVVARALRALQLSVQSVLATKGPGAPEYSHFVSIPLTHTELQEGIRRFQDKVLEVYQGELDIKVFNRPETFHITVAMLKLYSEELRSKATRVLEEVRSKLHEEVLDGQPLKVTLKGLDVMGSNPNSAGVLYARVEDPEGRVRRLCEVVRQALLEAGLFMNGQEQEEFKLHATLINTSHAKVKTDDRNRSRKRILLDMSQLLTLDLDLGTHTVPALHLSQRFQYDEQTRYYVCCSAVDLPA